jgi:hypothetical protein
MMPPDGDGWRSPAYQDALARLMYFLIFFCPFQTI